MSVFICDKTCFKFSQLIKSYFGKLFRQCRDISEMFLKPFKKLVVRVLSHLKHSATCRVLYVTKHSYSFIKHYINKWECFTGGGGSMFTKPLYCSLKFLKQEK